jgi:predicted transcriptional regulator
MDISIEKKNIVQWIQAIDDEKIIEKILSFKEKNEVSSFEKQLIQKGLNDVESGNVSSHEEVKKRFEAKFAKK